MPYSDTIANIDRVEPALQDVPCDHIFGLVVYDLPGRDCAAKASNGELPVGSINRYKSEYIDSTLTATMVHYRSDFQSEKLTFSPQSLLPSSRAIPTLLSLWSLNPIPSLTSSPTTT